MERPFVVFDELAAVWLANTFGRRTMPIHSAGFPQRCVVASSIAPMLSAPAIAATQISQSLLGHELDVIEVNDDWIHVRSWDDYQGWVHSGYLLDAHSEYSANSLCLGGVLLDADGLPITSLPWGSRVVRTGDDTVRLPDGREGIVRGELVPLAEIAFHFPRLATSIAEVALHWRGTPYLWGGVTPAGADCSGFIQAIFRVHGIFLPRDASEQSVVGDPVCFDPSSPVFSLGDLLFFSEHGNRVTHVALSLGDSRIVHLSLRGGGYREESLLDTDPRIVWLRQSLSSARRLF